MDIDEASRTLAAPTLVPDVPLPMEEHKAAVADMHLAEPQKAALAAQAFTAIEAGLAHLASLGHRFILVRAEPETVRPAPFPMMVYRDGQSGLETREVTDAAGLDAAHDEGWRDHPTAASEAEAEPTQTPAGVGVTFPVVLYRRDDMGVENLEVVDQPALDKALAEGWSTTAPTLE